MSTAKTTESAEDSDVEATDFPHVAQLGDSEGRIAAERLSSVCKELAKSGAQNAVQRLREIDAVVDRLPFPVIERLVAPERMLEELDQVQAQPVRRLHAWRNQAALLPLLITWVSLAVVVLMSGRSAESFVPIFAAVALVDAALIGSVVVLTRQAHAKELAAEQEYDHIAGLLDTAITSLAIAVESRTMREPVTAEDWAKAAGQVIENAVQQTKALSESGQQVLDDAAKAVESARASSEELVGRLADQTRAALESLQEGTGRILDRVVKDAVTVLHDAVAADRALINDQMAPLVAQFQSGVDDFAKSYRTYQESTATFVAVTADLGVATKVLGDSARSYSDIAESIDGHLRSLEGSQATFISQVTESVQSMGTAADAMETMSTLLRDRLRADLERITVQLDTSSQRLSSVDQNLVGTTHALAGAAGQLRDAATTLDRTARRRGPWPFRRRERSAES